MSTDLKEMDVLNPSTTQEDSSDGWLSFVETISSFQPTQNQDSSATSKEPAQSLYAAATLANIYSKFAQAKRQEQRDLGLSGETGSARGEVERLAFDFRELMKGVVTAGTAMTAEFCHGSCHSSHKGRSRR